MKMFDAGKTRMIGLLYREKNYDNRPMFKQFSSDIGTLRTDRFAISISRVSVLTRDKNRDFPMDNHRELQFSNPKRSKI